MATVSRDDVWSIRHRMVNDLLEELRESAKAARDPNPVHLIETHISWVLMGPQVYKLKKPVTLPFLDFSSFEARERACHNEVRINRRLAPRTYLGVVPIRRRADGRFTLHAGGGAVVEWAVHMNRLDDAARADHLLERGLLDRSRIDAVATALAAFHSASPTGPRIVQCGSPETIERHVVENFAALRETATELMPGDALAEIERWQIAFVRGRRDVFLRRMETGAIRDGHGDLRLEHVFFRAGDGFEIIDGIEFDDRYRWGDVCADVAFLAMDLARLGRVDLAERFVATYARLSDDFDLYGVLDFYESYRACVRAKICSSSMSDLAQAEARRCLLLAQSARRRPALDPVLTVVAGGIASGKTSISERLSDALGCPIVDADRTRKHLLGLAPTEHASAAGAWAGAYHPELSKTVYAEVLRCAGVVLASGRSVIVDASFRTAAARAAARELASTHNVPFRLIECAAPLDVTRSRLAARDPERHVSDATPAILDAFAAGYEPITELCSTEHVRLDTSGSLDVATARLFAELATWPRGLVG